MNGVVDAMFWAVIVVLWLPQISEILCLFKSGRGRRVYQPPPHPARLLFLIPAHNEELLISNCVRSLRALDYQADAMRVVVVADNCTDQTVRLARAAGAECFDRHDPGAPGKPQALVWALNQVDLAEWDAVVVVDADSVVDQDFATALASYAPLRDVVVQANFLVLNEQESWLTRLGGVLSRCRYEVTYPLKEAAGINCPMTGNGMCIGAGVLEREGWKAFSITEDSELYALYSAAGVRIHHAARANLRSQEVSSMNQGATQRRRWLAGRLWVIRTYGGRIIGSRAIGWHQKLDTIVELGLSSPVLHLLLAIAVAVLALVTHHGAQGRWLAEAALGSLAGLVFTTLTVLWNHPEPGPTLLAFLRLPLYAAWRILLLLGTLFTLGDKRWKRTARKGAT